MFIFGQRTVGILRTDVFEVGSIDFSEEYLKAAMLTEVLLQDTALL